MRRDDEVLITSYNPPLRGRVADIYTVPTRNIYEDDLTKKYPNGVPMVEVILEHSGKLRAFVIDVVKKV